MRHYDLSKLTVLVVEKHPPMRTMFREVLRQLGVGTIFTEASPEAGFKEFNVSTPDLVLIDWAPDFDGLSLVRDIRTHEDSVFPQVPVIMVTAYTETNHIYEALDAGMTEYLAKPVSARLLYLRIVSVIENQRYFIRVNGFFGPDRRRKRRNGHGGEDRRHETGGPAKEDHVEIRQANAA
ncbi:MAG: response regulator [Proteobacteria bacterium]|nr:response regulator [Pseudomonadota bacterium]